MFTLLRNIALVSVVSAGAQVTSVVYDVPRVTPANATCLDPYPVGLSFEFFMWPSYMTNITPPLQCMEHFSDLYGKTMPIRIGGTTQDRATYDPNFEGYVSYSVDDPLVAPMDLTYGPKFLDLIPRLGTETILGFNRGRNNRSNTFEAILEAEKRASKNLVAIELGNEPDLYLSWKQPIATPPWNETQEGDDNADWAQGFIDMWPGKTPILLAGSYAVPIPLEPNWPNTNYLINTAYNETVKNGTKLYSGHLYALSDPVDLKSEMNHVRTVEDINTFVPQIATAASVGKDYILGETNFHGLDEEMDATFGAALVTLDRTLRAVSIGLKQLFYHQGTINQAFFNWWSDNQVEAPFYGGFFSALALNGGDHIIAGDDGTTSYAQYVIFSKGNPIKVVLLNTDYYSGNGTRSETSFKLTGLKRKRMEAVRFTAASSEVTTEPGNTTTGPHPTIGGQYLNNDDCAILGAPVREKTSVSSGYATFVLAASEALIVYL